MNIAVISLGSLGDTLVVEPLCRNIRKNFPDSKIIYIVNKVFEDVPAGFDSVDEIFGFDKKSRHKGLFGYLRFAKEFPYKNKIDCCIITHEHERSIFVAKAIGAKKIISRPVKRSPLNIFINMKRPIIKEEVETTYKADYFSDFLKPLAPVEHFPVRYIRRDLDENSILRHFNLPDNYVVLSPTSKDLYKDWDLEDVSNFIKNSPLPVVLVGTEKAFNMAQELTSKGLNYIDLTMQTTVAELGVIIKRAVICVSVDTGTFHFAYAQGVKTIGIFYNPNFIGVWTPPALENVELLLGARNVEKDKTITYIKDVTYSDVLNTMNIILSNDVQ